MLEILFVIFLFRKFKAESIQKIEVNGFRG